MNSRRPIRPARAGGTSNLPGTRILDRARTQRLLTPRKVPASETPKTRHMVVAGGGLIRLHELDPRDGIGPVSVRTKPRLFQDSCPHEVSHLAPCAATSVRRWSTHRGVGPRRDRLPDPVRPLARWAESRQFARRSPRARVRSSAGGIPDTVGVTRHRLPQRCQSPRNRGNFTASQPSFVLRPSSTCVVRVRLRRLTDPVG